MSVGQGVGCAGTDGVGALRSWESRREGDVVGGKEECWGAGWDPAPSTEWWQDYTKILQGGRDRELGEHSSQSPAKETQLISLH